MDFLKTKKLIIIGEDLRDRFYGRSDKQLRDYVNSYFDADRRIYCERPNDRREILYYQFPQWFEDLKNVERTVDRVWVSLKNKFQYFIWRILKGYAKT